MEELKVEDANVEDLKDLTQTFIANLSPSEFESLDFKESLDVKLSKTGETIGMFKINVTKSNVYETENNGIMFEVTAECVGNVEQQVVCSFNAFAQLIYADGILRVSSQTHTELVKCGELQVNKVTETKLHADGTLVIKRRINDENESQIILTPEEARTYLCDGASLLLLRLMAQTNLTQKLAFITLDGDGQICPVIYYVTDSQATNQENDAEPKVLTKIVRELHREEKVDDWMFCLFNTGKLYSWTHTNSPVYMECRTVEEELNGNSLEDVQQETSTNENNVSEETVIDGGSHYANDALETNQPESQEKEDIPEDNERINADEDEGDKAKIENVDSTENLNFGVIPSLSVRHEQDQQNLSTIDEEDEDLLSISQKIPNNPNNKQQNAASSGSTLHIRGLFEDALSETPLANSNEIPLVREQTFNSDSTMHIKGLFEETYRSESKISDENVANSVGNVLLVPDNANTSGSTMFLKNFFEAGKSATTNVAKNEGQIENVVEREETFTSGSTMHLRGLFDSQNAIDNSRELSDSQTNNAVDAKAENTAVENYSELNLQKGNRGNTTDRTTSSSSSYHLRGLFASYKSGLNFQVENEDDNNTITRESTMEVHGLLDSTNNFGSQNVNAKMNDSNVILETNKENLSGFEADGEDKASKNELPNANSNLVELYEKFVSDKIFNGSTMQGDETNAEGYAIDVNDNPSSMPTLLSCIPRHVLLDSLYHHHKPSPIPEEDEENVEQEHTTRETQDETYDPLQINETMEIVQTKTELEPSVDFPLEMFDTKQSQGVLSRDTSLSFEFEPQHSPLNSVRALNKSSGNGIFPPLPASPRGDKRMMKLMSRRLSALMTGLDNSIGDGEPVGEESDKVNKSASVQKEYKTNGDRVKCKKERVDKTLANVNEKLDYQSDFNSFNRFMVLSRESSQLIRTPRNEDDVVETPLPDDNNKTDDVINIDSNDNGNESATDNADNRLEESSLKRENLNLLVTELNTQSPDDGMGSSDASARLSEKSPSLTFENFNDVQKFFKSECENYVENHPEIRKILGDFLQALLIARPDEILPFASSYFQFVANMKKD